MTYQQIVLFSLLAAIMVLMFWGRWRHDIVAFAGLMAAVILGVVPQEMAFSGFGNPTTLIVALVLVATAGLTRSGAVSRLTRLLSVTFPLVCLCCSLTRCLQPVCQHGNLITW